MRTARAVVLFLLSLRLAAGAVAAGEDPQFRTPESVRDELHLPRVEGDRPAAPAGRVMEVALVPRGARVRPFVDGHERTWAGARAALRRLAAVDEASLPPRTLLLLVDGRAPFGAVEWLLLAAADPGLRLGDVRFVVDGDGGRERVVPACYPTTRHDAKSGGERVSLRPVEEGGPVHFFFYGTDIGTGRAAYEKLAEPFSYFEYDHDTRWVLTVDPAVPFADVVRLLAFLADHRVPQVGLIPSRHPPAFDPPRWRLTGDVRKGIELPSARTGEPEPEGEPSLEVAVLAGWNALWADGEDRGVEGLQTLLIDHSVDRRDPEDPRSPSRLRVKIVADASRQWQKIQPVLAACADPAVRLPDVFLAVRDGATEKVLPITLPVGEPPEGTAFLAVHLDAEEGKPTSVTLKKESLGEGEKGFRMLAAAFASIRKRYPDRTIYGQIDAAREIPCRDVVRVVDEFRAADVVHLRFSVH